MAGERSASRGGFPGSIEATSHRVFGAARCALRKSVPRNLRKASSPCRALPQGKPAPARHRARRPANQRRQACARGIFSDSARGAGATEKVGAASRTGEEAWRGNHADAGRIARQTTDRADIRESRVGGALGEGGLCADGHREGARGKTAADPVARKSAGPRLAGAYFPRRSAGAPARTAQGIQNGKERANQRSRVQGANRNHAKIRHSVTRIPRSPAVDTTHRGRACYPVRDGLETMPQENRNCPGCGATGESTSEWR